MNFGNKSCIIIASILLLVLIGYIVWSKKYKESYSNIGAIDNLGSLDSNYELVRSPDDVVPAAHFADMVDDGDHTAMVKQPLSMADSLRPLERLDRVNTRDLLPRTAASVTPYHVDVANATTWAFSVNAPRVQLKNPVNIQADPYRGDIPITYHPDVPLVSKSQYGRDAIRLDGFFSDQFASLYSKYANRAYKNLPLKVSEQGTIADYIE
jgi:hypothetical protein